MLAAFWSFMIPRIHDTQRIVRIIGEDGSVESVEFDPDLSAPMIERRTQPKRHQQGL